MLSHSAESFCRRIRLCIRKIRVSKKIMSKSEKSRFSVEGLLSLCTKNFVGEPISVSKKSGVGNLVLEVLSRFSREKLSSQSTEKPFYVPQKLWYRKKLWIRAREGRR